MPFIEKEFRNVQTTAETLEMDILKDNLKRLLKLFMTWKAKTFPLWLSLACLNWHSSHDVPDGYEPYIENVATCMTSQKTWKTICSATKRGLGSEYLMNLMSPPCLKCYRQAYGYPQHFASFTFLQYAFTCIN